MWKGLEWSFMGIGVEVRFEQEAKVYLIGEPDREGQDSKTNLFSIYLVASMALKSPMVMKVG
jgi:hypothetical protein